MKKALVGYGGHAREVMAQMGVKLTCFQKNNTGVALIIFLQTLATIGQ